MSDATDHDPLEELLAPPGAADAAALRQAVLAATTSRQRRRRWVRRGGLVAALSVCFVAGMVTMRLLAPAAAAANTVVQGAEPHEPQAVPATQGEAPAPPKQDLERPANAGQSAALIAAGDRCLKDGGDAESALHCYTQALNAASEDEVKFSPDDNWLLMALKNAREKEAHHANHDS